MNNPSNAWFGRSRLVLRCGLLVAGFGRVSALSAPAPEPVDFCFQVRPILADRCFKCHGPDDKARKGKLRLDVKENAYAIRDPARQEAAIVPFHTERSQLCWRIMATNEDDRMPPPASNLSLTSEEKALLKQWVEQGAEYKPHWAFSPVAQVPVPRVADLALARNPVDTFVLARVARDGLKPAPEASRETLIRRLSFDLRGLPPSLEEIDAFVADTSPAAYERLVDRLLASPAYGEEQAALWLDLARFADTYGYQNDVDRDMSPWRDWVIRAFNSNLPYDQFILWQIAGDLLPSPTRDQILATAFNRLHRQTNEGGSIDDEFRAEYVADRVATTGTAFLGLTLGCARCHDHKYDPVSQKDFYRMAAFFNNIDESGLYSHFTRATPSPSLLLYPEGQEARHKALQAQIKAKETALVTLTRSAEPAFDQWLASGSRLIEKPEPSAAFAFETVTNDSTPDSINTNRSAALVDGPVQAEGRVGRALKFSGDNSVVCKHAGVFNRTTPFSFSLWLKPTEKQERAVIFHRSRAWTDSGSRGYELVLEDGRPAFSLVHFWPGNALKVRARTALPLNQWSHLTITYDGSSRAAGVHLYVAGELLPVDIVRDHLFKDILHRQQWGDMEVNQIELTLAGRFRDSGFKNGLLDEFQIFDRCLIPWEVKLVAGAALPGSLNGPSGSATPAASPLSSSGGQGQGERRPLYAETNAAAPLSSGGEGQGERRPLYSETKDAGVLPAGRSDVKGLTTDRHENLLSPNPSPPKEERGTAAKSLGTFSAAQTASRETGTAADRAALFAWYLQHIDAPYQAAVAELRELREQENDLINDVPEIAVMSEMSPPRPTYLLKRGAYDAPGEQVEPGVPERIFPFSDRLPRNRLGLARWLVDRRNPLTARVVVNRVWRSHFGRGLVETEEDFGTQGRLPVYPQLLDWLAGQFMENGWNVKALHKLIVRSATYRQSSHAGSELLAKDPENHLLAHGPKHRLRAEEIRDHALAVSGLLSSRLGGPSVRPYQPEGLWEESGTGKHYVQDTGEALYRRSLYTFWRRTAPPPTMRIFDAPSREVCTARRETTTTPLQALVLLNDPQFVEAGRVLAEQLVRGCGGDVEACVSRGFRLAIGRRPTPAELAVLCRLYQEQLSSFQTDPAAARQYLKTGEHPCDPALPAPQLAATAVVAGALMNLDEFVTLR